MSTEPQSWLTLARIVRTQGRKGEVLCDLSTDFPEQFLREAGVSLRFADGKRLDAHVEEHWMPTGRNAGRIVLKIKGTDSISDAEKLANVEVQIPADERFALDSETYYVNGLIGCLLTDGETELGTVDDLHFPTDTAGKRLPDAAALFVVLKPNGDEVLIPFANEFVQSISIADKRIIMNLPHGLVEMNG